MAIQSEAALEKGLIEALQKMNYEYVQIDEETNLKSNFKKQLEIHNKKLLPKSVVSILQMVNLRRS